MKVDNPVMVVDCCGTVQEDVYTGVAFTMRNVSTPKW
jgi:hypothetical protein